MDTVSFEETLLLPVPVASFLLPPTLENKRREIIPNLFAPSASMTLSQLFGWEERAAL